MHAITRSGVCSLVEKAFSRIAPLCLAEAKWDNVGFLVETCETQSRCAQALQNKIIFLTTDLTHKVLDEALQYSDNSIVIVSYHPLIFKPLKRLTIAPHSEGYSHINELIVRCIQNNISVYSPHTSLDNCAGGINDWIGSLVGKGTVSPIVPHSDYENNGAGTGRYLTLENAMSVEEIAKRLMRGFEAKYGGSVFHASNLHRDTDLLVTGEMSHHDILAANAKGLDVLLFEHSHTERNYLKHVLKGRLEEALASEDNVQVIVSTEDKEPVELFLG